MRRSHVWLLIAALWFLIAGFAVLKQGWKPAWLQALIAVFFLCIGIYSRRKERVR